MTLATLGFVFDPTLTKVLLIHKNRPDWQAGTINGPGGKIEPGESPAECIAREICEETSLNVPLNNWVEIGELHWEDRWLVTVLTTIWEGDLSEATSLTDEKIEWFPIVTLPENCISNLHWLIPLCKDKLENKKPNKVTAYYV